MTLIGMPQEEQNTVFRLIAAVLHLGNIMFEEEGDDASHVSPGKPEMALKTAADLLAINAEDLQRVLTTRSRETPEGTIVSPIDSKAAEINRDSLAKTIYSRLFDWLVGRINASIGQDSEAKSLIGVLDIYGFEQFRSNDFEQFCINLANEKLQQHFNQHVFKMEQAEYEREKIEWSYIEFVDNQDVLDLIEGKMGILDLLDESCRFPRATHEDFAQKLYSSQYISKSHRFTKPRLAKSDFSLDHYAGGVTYRTENFLEKNKDFVVADHEALMLSSNIDLLRSLFQGTDAATGGEAKQGLSRSSFKFSSVASRFKKQLTDLMDTLHKMEPHYIRCIKPNGMNNPMSFENNNVLHQLRCGGVLEAVRISCAGYPSKPYYEEFNDHYWPLAPDSINLDDRSLARKILESNLGSDGYQFGETRVFLRAGKMAELDKMRTEVLNTAAKTIQRCARAWMASLHFHNALRAIVAIQSGFRGHMARQLTQEIRYNKAAALIQSNFRRFYARRKFRQAVWAAIAVQKAWKIYCRHKIEMEAAKLSSATIVQSYWRAHVARTDFTNFRKSVIKAQNVWRCKLARRELLKRRVESRESSKLLQDKQDLQNKLNEMQVLMKKLQDQRSELRQQLRDEKSAREEAERLASKATEDGRRLLDAEKENMESENNELKSNLMNLKAEIAALTSQVKSKSDEASAAELKARENAEFSNKRISELENMLKEVQNKAKGNAEDLMNRLNNAVSQRDEAREQAMMLNAKLEQLQKEISSRRFIDSPVSTASGHLIASGVSSSPSSARVAQSPHQENGKLSPIQRVPGSRTVDSSTAEGLSEMDRRQKELFAKQQQLLREQRSADQEKLLSILRQDLGFHNEKPVAAVLVFRCCLQWKSFQADRTPIFDRINATMGEQVEECNEQNDRLAYWLSNTVSLLYLMQTLIKPASAGSGYAARLRQSGQQARGLLGSASKSLSAYFGRSLPGSGHTLEEASIHGGTAGEFRQVEAKYPALLFKQQLDAFVQRIFPMLRDNVKKEISPYLSACIHAPRSAHGSRTARRHASSNGGSSVAEDTSDPWKHILSAFEGLLSTLKANHVPPFLVCKLFEQLFSFVNVQLFNQLLLRRECCSFSNGEYVKTGLSEVEIWTGKAGRDWLGDAWDNLAHIRQAVTFLVIHQKSKKNLNEITSDLCPVLSIQQLYRISTMYWDDRYGTETVSHEVLARMKQLMVEGTSSGAAGHSFLLDEDANIPFTQEDIAIALRGHDLISEIPLPETLRDVPSFSFLNKKPELLAQQNTG